jgi:hypothetical protein
VAGADVVGKPWRVHHHVVRLIRSDDRWVWFDLAAFAWSVLLIVLACTVHDRTSSSDPAGIFHRYTLVHMLGPGILALVAAPAVIALLLAPVLIRKTTRRSFRAGRISWILASISGAFCLAGLIVQGVLVVPACALIFAAVASAPLGFRG